MRNLSASGGGVRSGKRFPFVLAALLALAVAASPVGGAVTVSVDTALDRRPVSPQIFGVNFGTAAQAAQLKWPVRRWGGNAVTRYNWQNDTSNKGMDWFFMNVPDDNPDPSTLPLGSSADRFLAETRAAGGEPILTRRRAGASGS